MINEVTLDELITQVKATEAKSAEPPEITRDIEKIGHELIRAASGNSVKIITDYDADGICSAYIMEKTLQALNPELKTEVICNDRRNSYGVPKDLKNDGCSRYVVLDMGSNELDYIQNTFGADTIVLDHHLIESEKTKLLFQESSTLLNPHCMTCEDGKSAEYCATGLSYRVYQELRGQLQHSEQLDNTIGIMACIGTVADMVNVLDEHSYNRDIIKNGLKLINNADEQNTDFVIGHMLVRSGIDQSEVTANQLAFNTGAFLNSASRMSELIDKNGAQLMYDALTGSASDPETFFAFDRLEEMNVQRKAYVEGLKDSSYHEFVDMHRFHSDDSIAVFLLKDDTPAAFAGLIAGRLTEATDKSIICLTYHTKDEYWSGSGRNASDSSSLKEFIDKLTETPDMQKVHIAYGGHHDAIGISKLDDAVMFCEAVKRHQGILQRNNEDKTFLKLDMTAIASDETLNKLKTLEPTGIGLKLPPLIIEGKELRRTQGFLKGHQDWKRISVKNVPVSINDWSYSPDKYPLSESRGSKGEIKFLADIRINTYRSQHTELEARWDKTFFQEHIQERAKSHPSQAHSLD